MNDQVSRGKTIKQCLIFAAFFAAVLFFMLRGQNVGQIFQTIRGAKREYILPALVCALVFPLTEGINIRSVLGTFGYRTTFLEGFKYSLNGFFFSSVSPGAVLGQPMQLYVMKGDDISISHGALALLMELTSFQISTFLFEIGAVIALPFSSLEIQGYMRVLAVIGFLLNFCYISFLLIVMFSKRMGEGIFRLAFRIIHKLPFISEAKEQSWKKSCDEGLDRFHAGAFMIRKHRAVMARVLAFSILQTLCWFSIPYLVYLALGQSGAGFSQLLLLQILTYMMTALLPLPGAMGIGELVFLNLFLSVYARDLIRPATLISRGISFYFLLLLSGILILLFQFTKLRKNGDPVE